ncbi:MAG: iron-containing alcohol dehydrogenase [Kiritimatiellae bacterium]|nr:iron-containing alcohol dehydrogenase [Kiritimatiellia bacterium]
MPQKTVSEPGAALKLAALTPEFGGRGVLVHGGSLRDSGKLAEITARFDTGAQLQTHCHRGGEPTVFEVDALRAEIRRRGADWVAAIGGGSVLDLAKAAAGLADHSGETAFYQLHPDQIRAARIPLIAAPTTAGTGSEATVVSVLTHPDKGLKQSIRHPSHMPRIVILDPTLLQACPPATIAAAGLDAFVQAFESYTSRHATPFTQCLAEFAIERIAHNLLPLFHNSANIQAAAAMLEASYITGLAFSHSRLGVVHGLAHPLGVRFKAAHGLTCACSLPAVLEFNQDQIQDHLLALKQRCRIDIRELVTTWMDAMQLTNPFKGKKIDDLEAFISETLSSGSTQANPRTVTADDVRWLLARIFDTVDRRL